jgi:hypothetical protein
VPDLEELAKELDAHFQEWRDSLTPAEIAELKSYQGFGFERVNRILRKLDHPSALSEYAVRAADLAIEKLDSAIAKGSTPRDLTVYRGVVDAEKTFGVGVLPGLTPGDLYTDLGYLSTSLSREAAIRKAGTSPNAMLIAIDVDAGHPAAWLACVGKKVLRDEMELLLPRRTRLSFVDLSGGGKLPMIRLVATR